MKRGWTGSQEKAITLSGKDILVTAGAGSGKTSVLTERIAQLSMKGCYLGNMLVVTFTKAAALEMRQRIQVRLEEIAKTGNAEEKRIAIDQLDRFAQANISTLHSFCTSLLRRHFYAVGIDPAFRVSDEFECMILKREALDAAIEESFSRAEESGDRSIYNAERAFSDKAESLDKLVLRIYNFILSLPNPWEWLDEKISAYRISKEDLLESEAFKLEYDELGKELDEIEKSYEKIIKILADEDGAQTVFQKFSTDFEIIRNARKRFDDGDFEIVSSITDHKFTNMQSYPRKYAQLCKEEVRACLDDAKIRIKKLGDINIDPESSCETINYMHKPLLALGELIKDFDAKYNKLKREKGMLDFADLEHFTLKALKNDDIACEYRKRFRYLFVDEYQDSNRVQEAIFNLVAENGNRFFVGDIKQSIYGFRLADPSLFLERDRAYQSGEAGIKISLRENFRSDPNILQGINDIFENTMEKFGSLRYSDEEKLIPGRESGANVNPISLDLILKFNDEDEDAQSDDEDDGAASESDIEREALQAVKWIRERMDKELRDKDGMIRKCKYSDFAILLRATVGRAEAIARIFAQEGIPAYVELKRGYFEALEIQVLTNVLRLIDNRQQDIALLSVLRAGIGGISDEDIIEIRKTFRRNKTEKVSFYRAMAEKAKENDELAEKCRSFFSFLDDARNRSRALALDMLIEWIIDVTQYKNMVAALPGGEQRSANLDVLLSKARSYESVSARGLYGFLRYIDRIKETEQDIGEARLIGKGSDCVRVMSLHSSKGLEFPHVLMLDVGKKFNMMDLNKKLVLHRDIGIGARYFDSDNNAKDNTLYEIAAKRCMRKEIEAEELRMLYVALTRAREELGIIATIKGSRKSIEKIAKSWANGKAKSTMLDYCMDVLISMSASEEILKEFGLPDTQFIEGKAEWRISCVDSKTLRSGRMDDFQKELYLNWRKKAAECDTEDIRRRYEWNYPNLRIPGKVAVSSLASGKLSFDETPKFLQSARLTAADLGTAVHTVLEQLDWQGDLDINGIDRQIKALIEREILPEEQAETIDRSRIARFCASDLGKRIKNAKNLRRELPFTIRIPAKTLPDGDERIDSETTILQGTIDACFEEEGKWILVDYKSDRLFDDDPVHWRAIAQKHSEQLRYYAKALKILTGSEVEEAYVFLLAAGEAVKIAI